MCGEYIVVQKKRARERERERERERAKERSMERERESDREKERSARTYFHQKDKSVIQLNLLSIGIFFFEVSTRDVNGQVI